MHPTLGESADIEATMTMLSGEPSGGLVLPPDPFTIAHRKQIGELAIRYRVPAIYAFRFLLADGGLVSYGVSIPNLFRQAAEYIDRILRGEQPADLPVQQPTNYELVVNLKTAKALGIEVPPTLLARADNPAAKPLGSPSATFRFATHRGRLEILMCNALQTRI